MHQASTHNHNGSGYDTFLQSTIPPLNYASFDSVTNQNKKQYAKQFSIMLKKKFYQSNDYEATSFMSERGTSICNIFGRHCVYLACKEKGVDEWRMWSFIIRSMLCHAVQPHISQGLLPEEVVLFRDNLGLQCD